MSIKFGETTLRLTFGTQSKVAEIQTMTQNLHMAWWWHVTQSIVNSRAIVNKI